MHRGEGDQEGLLPDDSSDSEALLRSYFDTGLSLFQSAFQSNAGAVRRRFRLCGRYMEVCLANDTMQHYITPALEHLACNDTGSPDITICVWDDIMTGMEMPPPPWFGYAVQNSHGGTEGLYTGRGDIRGFSSSRIMTAYNWSADALSMYDPAGKVALYWTKDARRLPTYEMSAPLRYILNWWVAGFDHHFAHGAAVGTAAGGVLLAGKGGSGKSTAALTCLGAGLLYASDDYCIVTAGPSPYAYGVFSSAKVDPGNLFRTRHIEASRRFTENAADEKAVFFLYPEFASQITNGFPLRAILLPRITGCSSSSISPAPHADCVKALAISTMCQFPGAGRTALDILGRIANSLPCYYLDFGTDPKEPPFLIQDLLESHSGGRK
jgi:hypothetical protein